MKTPLIYIIGSRGNMASRYKAILNHLKIAHTGHDRSQRLTEDAAKATHFIIASPTDFHIQHIESVFRFHKPILCEKPLTRCLSALDYFEERNTLNMGMLSMVNQYAFLTSDTTSGETFYDYFKSGTDGLAWDCINIIGLAKERPTLKSESPIWKCQINGKRLSIENMDQAYIRMLSSWIKDPVSNYAHARKAHEKVIEWCRS